MDTVLFINVNLTYWKPKYEYLVDPGSCFIPERGSIGSDH